MLPAIGRVGVLIGFDAAGRRQARPSRRLDKPETVLSLGLNRMGGCKV